MADARHKDREAGPGSAEGRRELGQALLEAQDRASWLALQCEAARSERDALLARVHLLENSIAFTLGAALIRARTPRGLLALPGELGRLARLAMLKRRPEHPVTVPGSIAAAPVRSMPAPARRAPAQLRQLRVAAVLDEFSHSGLAPECELRNLPSDGFERALDELQPHFLLVESAWRGHAGTWQGKLQPPSAHLRYLVDCCRRRGVPTVFWNKEDPVHFEHFVEAAGLFDYVFTTDSACITRYRERLRNDRVAHLSFFCQPRLQNPIETAPREAAACFAGSWYRAYPERAKDFEHIVDAVVRRMPVAIHDRNAGRGDPEFTFPERFAPMLKGRLEYREIEKAYKGYRYAIALNTVKDSPTMVSRRIYELLASNTITISNPAMGVSLQMGDLVVAGDDAEIDRALSLFEDSVDTRHRFRLRGLRAVLREHTAAHRLRQIAETVLGGLGETPQAPVSVLASARTPMQMQSVLSAFRGQIWENKRLLLVTDLAGTASEAGDRIQVLDSSRAAATPVPELLREGWFALFHPDDYYGPHYLTDLALATLYEPHGAIGKGCHFQADGCGGVVKSGSAPYRRGAPLFSRAAIVPCVMAGDATLLGLISDMESEARPPWIGLAADEFGYCRSATPDVAPLVDVPA